MIVITLPDNRVLYTWTMRQVTVADSTVLELMLTPASGGLHACLNYTIRPYIADAC